MSHPAFVARTLENGSIEYQRHKHGNISFVTSAETHLTTGDKVFELEFDEDRDVHQVESLEKFIELVKSHGGSFWLDRQYYQPAYPFSGKVFIPITYQLDKHYAELYCVLADFLENNPIQNCDYSEIDLDDGLEHSNIFLQKLSREDIKGIFISVNCNAENILNHLEEKFGSLIDYR